MANRVGGLLVGAGIGLFAAFSAHGAETLKIGVVGGMTGPGAPWGPCYRWWREGCRRGD